jgi:membrane fusion protein, heavy metal efflux system
MLIMLKNSVNANVGGLCGDLCARLARAAIAGLLLSQLLGCGREGVSAKANADADSKKSSVGGQAAAGQSPEHAAAAATARAVSADPMLVAAAGDLAKRLTIAPLTSTSVAQTIRIAGKLDVNQYRTSRIGAPIAGRLVQVDALFGQQVAQGQVLAEINSPDLGQAQLAFLRANSQQQLLTRAVERAQLLLSADVIGSAELQRRQSELTVAIAEKRAAGDQLRALGMTSKRIATLQKTGHIQASAPISAPLSGTVIERKVAQGQVVSPSDVLFLISDLSTLWAQAELPEQDAQFVKLDQKVEVEIPALDNRRIAGKVAYVADVVNPETRTVRVGVVLDNPQRMLKPSMLITMLIEGRSTVQQVVPNSAVVRENDRDHIFVTAAGGQFKLTPVSLGLERDGQRALLTPLPDKVAIVTDGAFHLNNVRAQRAIEGR